MKKIITLFLAVSLVCGVLSSCESKTEQETIEVESESISETVEAEKNETVETNEIQESDETMDETNALVKEALNMKHTLRFNEDGTFKICVFSDVHADTTLSGQTVKAIEAVLSVEQPDFVLFNGDLHASPETVEDLEVTAYKMTKYCVEHQIPWSHVYGNHDDDDGGISLEEQQKVYEAIDYCLSKKGDDNIHGVGNYVLPILRSDSDDIAFNIFALDSHSYLSKQYSKLSAQVNAVDKHTYPASQYGFVQFDQINWYYNTSTALEEYAGHKIPAVMCFHIPVPEYNVVANNLRKLGADGVANEGVCAPEVNSGMFMAAYERGDVKMFVSGHDHINDFCGEYCGIKLAYDGNIGFQTYYNESNMGCRVIEINQDDPWNFTTRMSYLSDIPNWNARTDVEIKESTVGSAPFNGDLLNAETDSLTEATKSVLKLFDLSKVDGNYYSSGFDCGSPSEGADISLTDGKGFEGSKAYSIVKEKNKVNSEFTLYLPETVKLGDAEYLRVWVDFTDIDFRKASFGFVTEDGCLYRTDEKDNYDGYIDLYYLPEGESKWQVYSHGTDGCFGVAQSSPVKNFKGWLAVPVSDFLAWSGSDSRFSSIAGSAPTADSVIAGIYFYFDFNSEDMLGKTFYMDEFGLVKAYEQFDSIQ